MKRLSLLFCALMLSVSAIVAQRTVTGTVTDAAGESLIGANLLAQGTSTGTITDIDGSFSLSVPDGTSILVFSFTGYETQEVDITGQTNINVVLAEGELLEEVVVTGLGIKKEKKALGYGVSTISSGAIANKGEVDVARILNGKATGVQIGQTSGLAGSGTNIIIRGYSSISGSNQPLFVVDGVPFNTDTNSDGSNFAQGSATASSRFLDLDPNNIEEINILKGLSATVLYGEAGRNGVVLVTTKTGSGSIDANKKLEVSVSQGISQSEIANIADYQNVYGNGFSGNYGAFFSNWGPAFDIRGSNGVAEDGTIKHPYDNGRNNSRVPQFAGARYPYQAYESAENFFQKGTGYSTSISAKKSFEDASVAVSYSYLTDEGFTPRLGKVVQSNPDDLGSYNYVADGDKSNEYEKHNLSLGASTVLDNGLRINGSFNFVTSNRVNPPAGSAGFLSTAQNGTAIFSDVLYTPRSVDLLHLPYEAADGSMLYYRGGSPIQNPLWTLNNATENEDIDRFTGNIQLSYDLFDWLTAQFRGGVDKYTQYNQQKVNKGGSQRDAVDGVYTTSTRLNAIYDHVLNLLYDYNVNDDWNINGLVGANLRGERRDYQFQRSSQQFAFDLFTHNNFITQTTGSFLREEKTNGVYASFTAGYKNYAYLTFQGRNDWTSTLEPDNRSVFYPSVSLAFVPSDAFDFGNSVSFLKLRVNYGVSAGYPDPYATSNTLSQEPRAFQTRGGSLIRTNSVSNFLGNPNLQAEKIKELEFGLEAKFLNNRIGVDFSVYDKNSSDLIITLALDPASGYSNTTINAAEVSNKGIELGLNLVPFAGKFTWDTQINFTTNENKVVSVAEGVDEFLFAGFNGLGNYAIPGETYGAIQGSAFEKNDAGDLLINSLGEYISTQGIEVIGDPNPNYNIDVINTFSWNNLSLGVQIAYVDGGDIYSATALTLLGRGNTTDTGFDRFLPIVLPGVLASDGTTPNNIQTYAGDAWFSAFGAANEGAIFDGTTLRIREASLSYALPEKFLENTPFGSLSFKVYGNNLWFKAYNFPVGLNFDPEVLSLGVGNGRGFDLFTGPTSKKIGAVLNITF